MNSEGASKSFPNHVLFTPQFSSLPQVRAVIIDSRPTVHTSSLATWSQELLACCIVTGDAVASLFLISP